MHVFRHPKYYKELRMQYRAQAISKQQEISSSTRSPGPGLNKQATSEQAINKRAKSQAPWTRIHEQ